MIREFALGAILLIFAKPLLSPIAYAAILSVSLYPLYKIHKRKYFGALLILASLILLAFVGYLLVTTVFDQVVALANFYNQLSPETKVQIVQLGSNIPFKDMLISLAKSLPSLAIKFVFFILFSYFFLVDGKKLKDSLRTYLPKHKANKLIEEGWHNLNAVISGIFVNMFLYIIFSTAVLHFTRSPAPLIYSVVASLFGILPILAAWMVYAFPIYFQFSSGNYLMAFILIVFQLFWSLIVDSYFKIKYRGTLHPAILLGSMAAGTAYFGFSGIIIGPLIITGVKTLAAVERHVLKPISTETP